MLCESYGDDRFDFRALAGRRQLKLELQYALQCRHDDRQIKTRAASARPVIALAAASPVASLLEWPMPRWIEFFDAHHAARHEQNGQLAFLRYAFERVRTSTWAAGGRRSSDATSGSFDGWGSRAASGCGSTASPSRGFASWPNASHAGGSPWDEVRIRPT